MGKRNSLKQYFEFHEPYLWLDSSATKAEAVKSYVKYVSDDPDLEVLKEVHCDYAFEKRSIVLKDKGKIGTNEGILKEARYLLTVVSHNRKCR